MPMTGKGLAKLIEECGELLQVAGKRLAYYTTDQHPDGGPPLGERLEEEMGDVMAAIALVAELHGLDCECIDRRRMEKLERFLQWHALPDNNQHGIDQQAGESEQATAKERATTARPAGSRRKLPSERRRRE